MTPKKGRWVDVPAADRRRIVNGIYVERTGLDEIVAAFDRLREDHREGKETCCLPVVGDPGVGKSALLKRYAAANGIVEEETDAGIERRRPVLYVELDPDTTVIGAAETALAQLMGEGAPTGSAAKNLHLPRQLRLWKVELIIFDEFQHVGERGKELTRSRTADWVKSITKKLNIPVVLAGMRTIEQLVEDNHQLFSISLPAHTIPHYEFGDTDHRRGFAELLGKLDEQLPFDAPSLLGKTDTADRLLLASGGYLRQLARIIATAARDAIEDGAGHVTTAHLREACEDDVHPTCQGNPFDPPRRGDLDEAA